MVALDTRSLLTLCLICKTSHMLVFPILNREITISPRSFPIFEKRFGSNDPRNTLVRKAHFHSTVHIVPFLPILAGFPYLNELRILCTEIAMGWDVLAQIEELVGDKLTTLNLLISPSLARCSTMLVSLPHPNHLTIELNPSEFRA